MKRIGTLALAAWLLASMLGVQAQDTRDAERRLREVRQSLAKVAAERRAVEGARGDASRKLRQLDAQVGDADRALNTTRSALAREGATLQQLQVEQARLRDGLQARRAELARLLRAAYAGGGDAAPLKALLAQDRIAEGQRALAYHGALQRANVARIRTVSQEIARVDTLATDIAQRKHKLDADLRLRDRQRQALAQARSQRAQALSGLDAAYQDKAERERALGRDARALQDLLVRLRAAAARAEREAAAARAREQREAARRQQAASPPARASNRRAAPVPPRPTVAAATPARQVGGMGWPVDGSLQAGFGGVMPNGSRSTGLWIAAPAGAPVRAVADGQVVYADWMTGYGNILIIDHSNGHMSLYAHNDGLLRAAGDRVRRGEVVASVGSSGGQERPGLYFELRRNGAPVNPLQWLQR